VDRYHSGAVCPCGPGFAKRFDRCRMGAAGAVLPAALACWPPAQVAAQADCRGDPLPAARWLVGNGFHPGLSTGEKIAKWRAFSVRLTTPYPLMNSYEIVPTSRKVRR
jgi:hypothetical protein